MSPLHCARGALPAARCERWRAAFDPAQEGPRPATHWPVPAAEVLDLVAHSTIAPMLRQALGARPLCRLDFSHARHGRPAHFWHQDGALRHDFLSAPADRALIEMRTLWIALSACGADAPSLEWVAASTPRLLLPGELGDDAVAARFGRAERQHALMQAGDALLFDGSLLHRSHSTPAMTQPRTSLELRFFRAASQHPRLGAGPTLSLP